MTSCFSIKKNHVSRRSTPLMFHWDFCVSTLGRETTSSYPKEKKHHCCGAVGTSTRAVACTVKISKSHSSSSSIVEVISPATLCSWICGAPGAPATFNSFGNPLQATSPFPHSSRSQIACLQRKNQQHTPHGTREQRKTNATKKHQFPSSEDVADASNQPHSWVGQPTLVGGGAPVLRCLRGSQSEPLPALLFLQHADVLQVIPHPYDLAAA